MAAHAIFCSIFLLICFEFSTASTENSLEDSSEDSAFWVECKLYLDHLSETFENMIDNGTIPVCFYDIENFFESTEDTSDEDEMLIAMIEKLNSMKPEDREFLESCWKEIEVEVSKKTTFEPSEECLEELNKEENNWSVENK